jgi:tetratricopeptide (TPR) repeat protein
MTWCTSRLPLAVILAAMATLAGCAARTAPVPPVVTTAKFPDFVMPAVPAGLGTPAAIERHEFAWRWLQAGDLKAAERNFTAALKQSPAFYPAEVGLGYVALAKKSVKDALEHFDRAVVANPRYAPALAGRADAFLAAGESAQALQSIEAALAADPSLTGLRSRLEVLRFRSQQEGVASARKLAEAGKLQEARAAYQAAIASSPETPFLHRELADVERREGKVDDALEHAQKAAELDPDEPRTLILLGQLYEAKEDFQRAADSFAAAIAIQPDAALAEKVETLRARAAFDAMPLEYRGIETAPTVTRAQLAALLAVQLQDLLTESRRVDAVVITDTRGSWAAPYILAVTRAGLMEVYANHTFQPNAVVRRVDLALAVSRALELVGARNPQAATAWRTNARARRFPDVGPRHINHPAASLAVESGVMSTGPDGTFQLTRPVTGAEAVAAVSKLQELAGRRTR